ncbi:SLC13 family permease [Hungatella effluvii]|uniref:SLC13 family permease n=1 Tax=Hungatella effluvii TaxID=1096246 RepID=UPI002A8069F5|nr:SLC13 family permease [Hungatella effluvii]
MENLQLYIALAVLVFMIISFLIHKFPYGLTAMTCVIVLALTGVIDVGTAFSGLSHTTTILVATMMVVAGAIGKTSIAYRIRQKMAVIQGKNGFLLVALISLFSLVLCQIMGQTAVMAIMLLIVQTLDDEKDVSQSRMILLVSAVICAWFGRFPVGMGAALPLSTNALYEGLVEGNSEYLLGMFDILKVGLIPSIALTIYCVFAWRLIPKQKIDASAVETGQASAQAEASVSKRGEMIIIGVFVLVMAAFVFSDQLGKLIYIFPAVGVLVLIYTNILSVREVVGTLTSDMIWMVAGILVISSALSSSGAGEFVGNMVLRILGSNPSSLLVITVFCVTTVIMTNFLSNNGTTAIMVPIAASTALAGGMNPKAVVLVVFCSSCLAIAFPTGCAAATMGYAIGNHNPIKTLKFTIPYLLIGMVTLIFSANFFFPVYG